MAGIVSALGVIGASRMYGALGFLVAYLGLWVFAVAMVWGLNASVGQRGSRVVWTGFASASTLIVVVGLDQVLPGYGFLVAAAVGLTSPLALALLGRLRRTHGRRRSGPAAPGVLLDPILLNRRFEDIVAQFSESDDSTDI